MEVGTLRYGLETAGEFGETVEWRHWGCVTPAILGELSALNTDNIVGFNALLPQDQQTIKMAISLRRINPLDIPASAKTRLAAPAPVGLSERPSQRKRKAEQDRLAVSQAVTTSAMPSKPLIAPSATQIAEDEVMEESPEEDVVDELFCNMNTNVVGIQYYKGLVGPGEQVALVREPGNRYDRNAIQVMNIGRVQVGHLPRQVAQKLAPLLDDHLVSVEGVINDGNLTGRSGTLRIYGASNARGNLEPRLIWATPGQRGFPSRQASSMPSNSTAPASNPATYAQALSSSGAGSSINKYSGATNPVQSAAQQEATRKRQQTLMKQQEALRKAAELRQMLNSLEKVDDEGRRSSLLDTLCSNEDILNLPLHPNPPGIKNGDLQVDLLRHQSQALQWCIEREYPVLPKKETDKPVQFWQVKKNGNKTFYYNIATKTPQEAPPLLGRGALCADAMGLVRTLVYDHKMQLIQCDSKGKTLTMLALILATKDDILRDFSKTTLIVAPLSVLSNWEKQVYDHCAEDSLSVCVYYNTTRSLSAEDLVKYDVVITTYQTVAGEFAEAPGQEQARKKRKVDRSLFDRIILDEGHTIRNPKTKMAKAVFGLNAQRRWVLTGTPIVSRICILKLTYFTDKETDQLTKGDVFDPLDVLPLTNPNQDLGSILSFLQICRPLDNEDFYKRLLLRPLKDGDPAGVELLRVRSMSVGKVDQACHLHFNKALMSHICIRRTKEMQDSAGMPLIPLPPVDMIIVPVTLTDEARTLYDEVEEVSKQRFEHYMNSGTNSVVQSNVLSMLTRMRQLALHPGLVPPRYLEELRAKGAVEEAASHQVTKLTPDEISRLRGLLARALEDFEECPICFGVLNEAKITSCGHMYCLPCPHCRIDDITIKDRRPLGMGDLYDPPPPTDLTQAVVRREEELDTSGIRGGSSAKIDQLVHLLRLTPPTEKSLVFSQFTSFLDKIAETLDAEGIPYVQFNGQMSAKRRQETISRFSVPITEGNSVNADNSVGDDDDAYVFNNDDDDDDDIDDDDDTSAFSAKRHKGKKNKSKGKARASGTSAHPSSNPKVMLLSLKAGAVGLNLTGM
ncbi:hypothetical protein DXG01_013650 [Tephrocybe rancida]|nr:hypothetical protein DXG01_013650 [Tephrocybe rancida]